LKYYKETEEYKRPHYGFHIFALDFDKELVRIYYSDRGMWTHWSETHESFIEYASTFSNKNHFKRLTKKEAFFEVL